MKETIKKIIASVMAMATISIFFGGCSKQDTSSNSTPITSSISTTYTSSSVSSSTTPGADTSTDITDNSLFHWVEEPAGSEAAVTASEFIAGNNCQVDTDESKYDLPVYTNGSERYVHAGNLLLPLDEDGAFVNEEDEMLVRHVHEPYTDGGAKIYLYRNPTDEAIKQLCQDNLAGNEDISKRVDKFWNTLGGQVPTEHNPYVVRDDLVTIPDNALVWYNGIATDARALNSMIPLKVLTDDFMNILSYTETESGYAFNLYTGIGTVCVSAIKSDVWTFSYSLPENCKLEQSDVILPSTAISADGNDVYVSADVLTQVFKYFVFTFSSVDMGDGSTEDIAVIVTDNQDILKSSQSSQGDNSTSNTTDSSSNSSDTSDTSDTHEPTSEPTSSSSSSNSKPTGDTSKPETSTSKPTSSSSQPTTSKPTGETSKPNTSKPTSSSSSSGGNASTPTSPYWNPDAPGNKPGPYKDSYIDAAGKLHAKADSVPLDSYGYPVESFYTEFGTYRATKAEKEAARAEEERIAEGGGKGAEDAGDYDGSKWGFKF